MTQPMLANEVAQELKCSTGAVHNLDDVLQPVRTASGVRIYDRERVAAVAAQRAAQRAQRAAR